MSVTADGSPRSSRANGLAELAHANRYSAVGELTTSIAHELNQPLGSILTNAETAELMLKASSPDLDEISQILADIRRDDQRASEVIRRLRSVLKKTPFEIRDIELNDTVREAIGLVAAVADGRRIALSYAACPHRSARQGRSRPASAGRSQPDHQRDGRDLRCGHEEARGQRVDGPRRATRPRSGLPTPVRDRGRRSRRTSSIRSSRPSRKAWAWGLRSPGPSSRPITARSRPRTSHAAARCSRSGSRSSR